MLLSWLAQNWRGRSLSMLPVMLTRIWKLITRTFSIWGAANASRMSAALTYYTMLSLAPTLMIAIAIAGFIFDDSMAESEIIEQVQTVTTPEIAQTVAGLIKNATNPDSGLIAGTISLCILVFAASGVFTQLYDTFNDIWEVSPQSRNGFLLELKKRLIGIGMVIIAGVALIAALLINSAIAYLSALFEGSFPVIESWLNIADQSLSFFLMPIVFTLIFWFVPATRIHWKDVWPAGILTALLVAGSRYLIGLYLRFSTTSEVYGAAGSLVILLIWVYVIGLVVFFGASFCHAWALTFGSRSSFAYELGEEEVAPSEEFLVEGLPPAPIVPKRRS